MKEIVIFILLSIFLYFLSRQTINEIFYFFYLFIKDKKTVFLLLSLIFFPGTVVHELSHFFLAMILFLPVKGMEIFPKFEGQMIKLGTVNYIKKDFFRGFLVGIAPLFGALLFFWIISHFPMNLFFYYLIFTVSSNMFSSKKDLEDLIYLIPLGLIIAAIGYILNVSPRLLFYQIFTNKVIISFFSIINHYLLISLLINFLIFGMLRLIRLLIKNLFKIYARAKSSNLRSTN